MDGTIVSWDKTKQFGFIRPNPKASDKALFCHITAFGQDPPEEVHSGLEVYHLEIDWDFNRGPRVVALVGEEGLAKYNRQEKLRLEGGRGLQEDLDRLGGLHDVVQERIEAILRFHDYYSGLVSPKSSNYGRGYGTNPFTITNTRILGMTFDIGHTHYYWSWDLDVPDSIKPYTWPSSRRSYGFEINSFFATQDCSRNEFVALVLEHALRD